MAIFSKEAQRLQSEINRISAYVPQEKNIQIREEMYADLEKLHERLAKEVMVAPVRKRLERARESFCVKERPEIHCSYIGCRCSPGIHLPSQCQLSECENRVPCRHYEGQIEIPEKDGEYQGRFYRLYASWCDFSKFETLEEMINHLGQVALCESHAPKRTGYKPVAGIIAAYLDWKRRREEAKRHAQPRQNYRRLSADDRYFPPKHGIREQFELMETDQQKKRRIAAR